MQTILKSIFFALLLPPMMAQAITPLTSTEPIMDSAHVLEPAAIHRLRERIKQAHTTSGSCIYVLTIDTTGGEQIESYSQRVVVEWGLDKTCAQKHLFMLFAMQDKKVRIEVGKRLQISDAKAQLAIDNQIIPAFKRGAYEQGIYSALQELSPITPQFAKLAEKKNTASPESTAKSTAWLKWPRRSNIRDIKDKIPELKCFTYQGEDICTAKVDLLQISLLRSQEIPIICTIGKEVAITSNNDVINSVNCEASEETARALSRQLLIKGGKGRTQENQLGPMKIIHQEWKVEHDYVMLSHYSGADVYGNPLNTFEARVSIKSMLPAKK